MTMKRTAERIFHFLADLLFPPRCVFCSEIIPPGTQICENCEKTVLPEGTIRNFQLHSPNSVVPCAALFSYEGKVRESMLRYKFYGEKRCAQYYAEKLSAFMREAFPGTAFSLVTWVPLSESERKKRSYDQAEWISRLLARELGLPCLPCLKKTGKNRVQHLLRREERAANVHGVYSAIGGSQNEKTVLLVDDIVTTGATLSECAAVLLRSGAKEVICAAAAHTDKEAVEK
jgi:competence protein ComFC